MQSIVGILGCLLTFFLIIFMIIGKFAFNIYKLFHRINKNNSFSDTDNNKSENKKFHSFRYKNKKRGSEEEMIIDRRDPNTANKKIFSEDDGEYIDFEEEK